MRLIELAGFDENLRPLSPARLARQQQIRAMMRRAAAAAREGRACAIETAICMAIAAPVAVSIVLYQLISLSH